MTVKFSTHIKNIREEKKLTLREAAKLIGISHTRLIALETGLNAYDQKTQPTLKNIVKIAKVYNLPIVELMKMANKEEFELFLEEMLILKEDEKELVECYRDLGRHKKTEILDMLKQKTSRT